MPEAHLPAFSSSTRLPQTIMPDIVTTPKRRETTTSLNYSRQGLHCEAQRSKSLRAGRAQIRDAFARVENMEVWLYNAHIEEYSFGNWVNHEPKAKRKLLLNKSEIRKIFGLAAIKGHAVFPLSLYWKNGKVKVKLAIGKGKSNTINEKTLSAAIQTKSSNGQ
jgi:SsrA-binding protein